MRLTETIQVKRSKEVSKLCHLAKNLYNLSNWYCRQEFFNLGNFLSYYDLHFILKHHECYKNLPAQTSQQLLKLVIKNWKSYFRTKREWNMNRFKFKRVPKIPRYKRKDGESIVIFTNQNARIKDDGCLHFPKKCDLKPVKTRIRQFQQVRIIPLGDIYKIEIIHEREAQDLGLNKDVVVSKSKRVQRGLFKSHNGTIINADVNAGYNIMKKAFPNSIPDDGIQGLVLNPQVVKIS